MFLTMELLRGETVASRLQRGSMTRAEAFPLIEQMAAGLHAAHEAGVVHRDFKSANVMLVPGEHGTTRAVITDFGIARKIRLRQNETLTSTMTERGGIPGTPDYMAPEQLLGHEPIPAVDIYALGVVMYEMITVRRPFEADTPFTVAAKRLDEDPPPPCRYASDVGPIWEGVILRCLERQPSRFGSATKVVQALKGLERTRSRIESFTRRRVLYTGIPATGSIVGSLATWRLFRVGREKSLAIWPFVSTDPELEYLSDGVTEDLINALGQAAGCERCRDPLCTDIEEAAHLRWAQH